MEKNNFFTVGMFQLKLNLASNYREEYLIADSQYFQQMEIAIQKISSSSCDIVIFPEMSYHSHYFSKMIELSSDKIIIFGSVYENEYNTTKVFCNGECFSIIKRYPSGAEPMSRKYQGLNTKDFISQYLKEHTFLFHGINVYVLNCMEYYELAYYIARDRTLNNIPFILCCTCSNSNTNIFLQESAVIHNHNEFAYTFMCNAISQYNDKPYGDGQSYIYGPIQNHQREWLLQENLPQDGNINCIVLLNNYEAVYCEGTYFIGNNLSRFGRSDFYYTTPQNVSIQKL